MKKYDWVTALTWSAIFMISTGIWYWLFTRIIF